MANYINTITGKVLTECELYDLLLCGCSAKYYTKWKWENDVTHEIMTGREWLALWEVTPPTDCVCADPLCSEGREVAYYNMIEHVTSGGTGSDRIALTLIAATYVNNEQAVPPTPVYTVDFGDGTPTEPIAIGGTISHNVAALADGLYNGTISWEGATFDFFFTVVTGRVDAYQAIRQTTFTPDISCALYPDYTFDIQDVAVMEAESVDEVELKVFSNVVNNTVIGGAGNYDESGQLISDLSSEPSDLIVATYSRGVEQYQNTGIYRTQCIE